MIRFLFYCLIFFIFCKNSFNNFEYKIIQSMSKSEDEKIINLKDITDFKWDTLIASNLPISHEEINKIIGINYPDFVEFTRPIIFLKDGKIIHYENNPCNYEGIVENQVIFGAINDTSKINIIVSEDSKFILRKKQIQKRTYYELIKYQGTTN